MDITIVSILKNGGVKCPRCYRCHYVPDIPDFLCERCSVILLKNHPDSEGNVKIREALDKLAILRGLSEEEHFNILVNEYKDYI